MSHPEEKEIKDLARHLSLSIGNPAEKNWGKAVFLIGAGCSASVGIPLAAAIAKDCVIELAEKYSGNSFEPSSPEEAIKYLYENKWLHEKELKDSDWDPADPNWGNLYGKIFENHFQSDIDQQRIINNAIGKSDDKINWAHICLGELVSLGYIHTVITTNFDQLVLRGIISTGVLPVIADGIESLTRVHSNPLKPQVVHIHGSMHTYNLRNSKAAVKAELEKKLSVGGMLYELVRGSNLLVVVGYAGGEEAVMSLLQKSARHFKNMIIFWVLYEKDINKLSKQAKKLLKTGNHKYCILNKDADNFFLEIMENLGIGAPRWMKNPVENLLSQTEIIKSPDNIHTQSEIDIQREISVYSDKVNELDECWKGIVNNFNGSLPAATTLRLQGRFEEATQELRKVKEIDYSTWRMKAETAFEAGQSSQEINISLIKESINAWNEAVKKVKQKENPISYYETQIGLGNTIMLLLEIDPSEESALQAVKAFRSALKVNEIKDNKEILIKAQNNLGIALLELYEFNDNAKHVEDAVKAHEAALKEIVRENSPIEWAETQSNLAGALERLGELEDSSDSLKKAVLAYEAALEEYRSNKYLDDWAETQSNLAGVYKKIGEENDDHNLLEIAASSYKNALKHFTRELSGDNWAWSQFGLGSVLHLLGESQRKIPILEDARDAYLKALEYYQLSDDANFVQSIEEKLRDLADISDNLRMSKDK